MVDAFELTKFAAAIAKSKKAENIIILDIRKISTLCDFTMICSVLNTKHAQAVFDEITKKIQSQLQIKPICTEGESSVEWVIIDYGHAIINIFQTDKRQIYNLEQLWNKAIKINFD